jgi:hypothetical protein
MGLRSPHRAGRSAPLASVLEHAPVPGAAAHPALAVNCAAETVHAVAALPDTFDINDARAQLSRLIARAHAGEVIILTKGAYRTRSSSRCKNLPRAGRAWCRVA